MKTKLLAAVGAGALILVASQSAMAGVSVGLNFGIPAPVYVAPAPVYAPPPAVVAYQPVGVVAPALYVGWHGDRYWDGRRWAGHRGRYERRGWY
ncbi:hypothetical protein [Paraburkholderia sp.]|uniref:hypothetical protein n=1 Tax=Paraburkholderia sp. TaxID=1926495 RepID=UPI0025F888BF|nr:hypothetical protein [Paraburkholderia sp.]